MYECRAFMTFTMLKNIYQNEHHFKEKHGRKNNDLFRGKTSV